MYQSRGPTHPLPLDMADVLYRCTTTGQNVQVWYADDVPDDNVYLAAVSRLRQSPSCQPSRQNRMPRRP